MPINDILSSYNLESKEEDIIKECQKIDYYGSAPDKPLLLAYFLGLLNLKQQKKIIDDQNKTSGNIVKATWVLAIATWVLALATIILVLTKK